MLRLETSVMKRALMAFSHVQFRSMYRAELQEIQQKLRRMTELQRGWSYGEGEPVSQKATKVAGKSRGEDPGVGSGRRRLSQPGRWVCRCRLPGGKEHRGIHQRKGCLGESNNRAWDWSQLRSR